MTNHNDPQFERTIEASLTQHSLELGSPSGQLDDVMARVDRRRNRRRSVAVVGSLAAISVGVFGIASVSGRNPDQIPGAADAPSDDMTAVQVTDIAAYTDAWACQIPVTVADPQPDTQYFELCEPHGLTSENPEAVPPTTGPECSSFVDTNPPIATATSTTTTIDPPNSDVLISTPVPTLAPIESACSYVEGIPTTTFVVSAVDSDEPIWIVEAGESWPVSARRLACSLRN